MELQFIWVDNFHPIHNQGFNLDKKTEINFSLKKNTPSLEIIYAPEIPNSSFWSNKRITNVNAIIGQNGAGKTTFLRFLFSFFGNLHIKALLIFKENQGDKVLFNVFAHEELQLKYEHVICLNAEVKVNTFGQNVLPIENNLSIVYLSNSLSLRTFWQRQYTKDVSTSYLLEEADKMRRNRSITQYTLYKHIDLKKQSNFIINKPREINFPFLNSLSTIGFYFTSVGNTPDRYENIENLPVIADVNKLLAMEISHLEHKEPLSGRTDVKNEELSKALLLLMFLNRFFQLNEYSDFKKIATERLGLISTVSEFIRKFKNEIINNVSVPKELSALFDLIINKLTSSTIKASTSSWRTINNFDINVGLLQFDLSLEIFSDFINVYEDTIIDGIDYIDFVWHLSSGENAYLSNFARLFALTEELNKESNKSLIILIDEVDLYLHPQWQKEYINIMLDFLPKIFNHKEIQLIITSHSPIIVSDIPSTNIVFLRKEDSLTKVVEINSETFGSNIHSLYTHSFFITNGLIGEFAKKKINDFFSWALNEADNRPSSDFEQLMNLIEEPILKMKLFEAFAKKTNKNIEEYRLKAQRKIIDNRLSKLSGENQNP